MLNTLNIDKWPFIPSQDPDDAGDTQVKLGESRGAEGRERGETVKQNTGDREKDSLDMRDADNIIRGESETTEYDFSTDDESLRSCDPLLSCTLLLCSHMSFDFSDRYLI